MPVEIRELVIKASIDASEPSTAAGNSGTPGEELVKICVDKVLEILKEKNER